MSVSERYEKYFHKLEIADIFRESYVNWVENCNDEEYLKSVEEIKAAVRTFFATSTKKIVD
jgi:thiaminase